MGRGRAVMSVGVVNGEGGPAWGHTSDFSDSRVRVCVWRVLVVHTLVVAMAGREQ